MPRSEISVGPMPAFRSGRCALQHLRNWCQLRAGRLPSRRAFVASFLSASGSSPRPDEGSLTGRNPQSAKTSHLASQAKLPRLLDHDDDGARPSQAIHAIPDPCPELGKTCRRPGRWNGPASVGRRPARRPPGVVGLLRARGQRSLTRKTTLSVGESPRLLKKAIVCMVLLNCGIRGSGSCRREVPACPTSSSGANPTTPSWREPATRRSWSRPASRSGCRDWRRPIATACTAWRGTKHPPATHSAEAHEPRHDRRSGSGCIYRRRITEPLRLFPSASNLQ